MGTAEENAYQATSLRRKTNLFAAGLLLVGKDSRKVGEYEVADEMRRSAKDESESHHTDSLPSSWLYVRIYIRCESFR
jgi:hypothetical protein